MIYSQKSDGQFSFNQHLNPILSEIVDSNWRKDSFKNINIYIPESSSKGLGEDKQASEMLSKFQSDNKKEWSDYGLFDLLGKYADPKELDRRIIK